MTTPRALPLLLATVLVSSGARPSEADPVVAEVAGTSVRTTDVSRRLAAMPEYQRRTLGATPQEVTRRIVDDVLVPEARLSAAAGEGRLAERPIVRARLRDALRRALVESLRDEAARTPPTDVEIAAYHRAHLRDFEQPERVRIFRILVDDVALAKRILTESRADGGLVKWKQFSREHSLDTATKMRAGALGFVAADGTTDVPQLQVDKVLFEAASKVRDGELVPEPVREGEHWAAVWRRGTQPATSMPPAEARARIVYVLQEQRLATSIDELLTKQRAAEVKDENPDLLEALPPSPAAPPPPPRASGAPQTVDPAPKPTDRGLR